MEAFDSVPVDAPLASPAVVDSPAVPVVPAALPPVAVPVEVPLVAVPAVAVPAPPVVDTVAPPPMDPPPPPPPKLPPPGAAMALLAPRTCPGRARLAPATCWEEAADGSPLPAS